MTSVNLLNKSNIGWLYQLFGTGVLINPDNQQNLHKMFDQKQKGTQFLADIFVNMVENYTIQMEYDDISSDEVDELFKDSLDEFEKDFNKDSWMNEKVADYVFEKVRHMLVIRGKIF